jgi:hypothetical protein
VNRVDEDRDRALLAPIIGAIHNRTGGAAALAEKFPAVVRDAVDYVIDPVRTARTSVAELDNVEKTFIGLKVEHFARDFLDVPRGVRDLVINGTNVDVKNTIGRTWMIPHETYSENGICLLIKIDDVSRLCWLGLIVARVEYLGAANRDQKRSVSKSGMRHIHWLLEAADFGASEWEGLDMARFRQLRSLDPGVSRAATFFEENLGRRVSRRVVQALLLDQKDPMKRLRGNGGAKDVLRPRGIELTVNNDGSCVAIRRP